MNFVCEIQDVTRRSQGEGDGKSAAKDTGRRQKEATDEVKNAKGMWWRVWKGQCEVAHCKCWGGKERSLLPSQFVVLTKQLHPTGCWKQAPLAQTGICLFASMGAQSVSTWSFGHGNISEHNPLLSPL